MASTTSHHSLRGIVAETFFLRYLRRATLASYTPTPFYVARGVCVCATKALFSSDKLDIFTTQ